MSRKGKIFCADISKRNMSCTNNSEFTMAVVNKKTRTGSAFWLAKTQKTRMELPNKIKRPLYQEGIP